MDLGYSLGMLNAKYKTGKTAEEVVQNILALPKMLGKPFLTPEATLFIVRYKQGEAEYD